MTSETKESSDQAMTRNYTVPVTPKTSISDEEWGKAKLDAAFRITHGKVESSSSISNFSRKLLCFKRQKTRHQEIEPESKRNYSSVSFSQELQMINECPLMSNKTQRKQRGRKISVCQKEDTDRHLVYKTLKNFRQQEYLQNCTAHFSYSKENDL